MVVKNILKYLRRIKDSFLIYEKEEELIVKGYTNISFQFDKDDSRSQFGYVFCLNNGAVVEPLFDFNDTKILVLLFLIKFFSVSKMNLTPKAKTSLWVLKIQYPVDGFESHMDRIRILIPESEEN